MAEAWLLDPEPRPHDCSQLLGYGRHQRLEARPTRHGELLLRLPVARGTRFTVDSAGRASAGVAAAAATDFDIQRNAVSIATMRFAAAAATASFIAATETVLEPGDVLSVIAPATVDVTLADIGL